MLIIHCPHCSNGFDLVQAWQDKDARRFTALITSLPPKVVQPCFIYLTHCFKPPKQALRWSKLIKLLQELVPMIKDAQINHNGTLYRVPLEHWVDRMQQLVDSPPETLRLPLKDHAYLLKILSNQAERSAGKAESKAEADKLAGVRAKPTEESEPSISFAQLTDLALRHTQDERIEQAQGERSVHTQENPVRGELVEPQKKEAKEKKLSIDVKTSLKHALNLPSTQASLTLEEKEARKAEALAQAKALMRTPPQPTLD